MLRLTLKFWLAGLAILTLSRLGLMAWLWPRVAAADGIWPIIVGGLRFDVVMLAMLSVPVAVLAPWLEQQRWARRAATWWYGGALVVLVFFEAMTPGFIAEYDVRPNRLVIEYLGHPREVAGMLWQGFGGVVAAVLALSALAIWAVQRWLRATPAGRPRPWWWRATVSMVLLAAMVLGIRGTLQHRPINPATVAFSQDTLLNTLPLNSLYAVTHAAYRLKDERSASALYGKLPEADIVAEVRAVAGLAPSETGTDQVPTAHRQQAHPMSHWRPRHLVIIVEESLGAQFVGHLQGRGLTPALDALAAQGWAFSQAYATGTRSARGLEAIVAGFLPTPAEAVLKLPRAQGDFFTLASALGQAGYVSRFVYGGEAHFDNMKGFFLANGFNEVIDRPRFRDPAFVGSWGASDEDLFAEIDRVLRAADGGPPTFTVGFTVSHHTPWDYPAGRIAVEGEPATQDNAIRYADWALGRFFAQARQAPYWQDTLFLVIADHDARVGGASLIPVQHFRIPAVIVGAGIAPRRDDRIVSQVDFAPTLLSLLGVSLSHPMLGHDLTQPASGGRAMLQYGDNFGWLTPAAAADAQALVVLAPGQGIRQFAYRAPDQFTEVPLQAALQRQALAHALWAEMAYRKGQYRTPPAPTLATLEPRS